MRSVNLQVRLLYGYSTFYHAPLIHFRGLKEGDSFLCSKLEHLIKAALGQQSSIVNTQGGPSSQQGVQALVAELPPNLAAEQAASHERKRKRDTEPSKVLAEKKAQAGRRKKKKGRHTWKVEEVIQLQDAMIEAARKFREPKFGKIHMRKSIFSTFQDGEMFLCKIECILYRCSCSALWHNRGSSPEEGQCTGKESASEVRQWTKPGATAIATN